MKLYKYTFGYLVFIFSAIAASFVTVALGWSVFELGITTTIMANILIGLISYAIGILYLFAADKLFKRDFFGPEFHFYIWALIYGLTEGLGASIYAPYMPNAIWLDGILNGAPFRFFVPAPIITTIYVLVKMEAGRNGSGNDGLRCDKLNPRDSASRRR